MDLPTYTSIWRIEKRLYKLYDFRLPMPVPVGQIAVFAAITVPYVILLTILGLPFNHTLFWLYVLPPGLITWLATRPVLESKRLPELVISQVRYLGEPGTWCRMAPLAEKDDVVVIGKVWRRDEKPSRSPAEAPALAPAAAPDVARRPGRRAAPARVRPAAAGTATATQALPAPAAPAAAAAPAARVPRTVPAPRRRRVAEPPGRAVPWPGGVPGPEAVPPAAAAGTAPAEITDNARQAPMRPAAEPAGRPAARLGLPVHGPAHPARDEEAVTDQARPGGRAARRGLAGQGPALARGRPGPAHLDHSGAARPGPAAFRDSRPARGAGGGRSGPGGRRSRPGRGRSRPSGPRSARGKSRFAGPARHGPTGSARWAGGECARAGCPGGTLGRHVSQSGRVLHRRAAPRAGP